MNFFRYDIVVVAYPVFVYVVSHASLHEKYYTRPNMSGQPT